MTTLATPAPLGRFERFPTLWVALCFVLASRLNRRLGESHAVACPSTLIGASNFFALAVASAIGLFGSSRARRSPPPSVC